MTEQTNEPDLDKALDEEAFQAIKDLLNDEAMGEILLYFYDQGAKSGFKICNTITELSPLFSLIPTNSIAAIVESHIKRNFDTLINSIVNGIKIQKDEQASVSETGESSPTDGADKPENDQVNS